MNANSDNTEKFELGIDRHQQPPRRQLDALLIQCKALGMQWCVLCIIANQFACIVQVCVTCNVHAALPCVVGHFSCFLGSQ